MPSSREVYLGDAVYVSFDGYQIWLRTGDGNNQRIALDPYVFRDLQKYIANIENEYIMNKVSNPGSDEAIDLGCPVHRVDKIEGKKGNG